MKKIIFLFLVLFLPILLISGAVAQSNPGSPSNGGVQPVWVDGNPACDDLDQLCDCTTGFKPPGNGIGTFTYPDGQNQVTATSSDDIYFDWSSDLPVCCVIVKGGNNANVYQYDPPAYSDGNLHAPINPNNNQPYGISHIEYCYGEAQQLDEEMKLTSMCHTGDVGTMRLRNPNDHDIEATWQLYGSSTGGTVTALANSDTFFDVPWPGTIVVKYMLNGFQKQTTKAQNNTECEPPDEKLTLTSMCYISDVGTMRLRNPNDHDFEVTWQLYGSSTGGTVIALANSDTFFDVPHPGTIVIHYTLNAAPYQDVKAQNNTPCPCPIELTEPSTSSWQDGDTDVIENTGDIAVTFTYAMDWVTLDGRVEFYRETVTLQPGETLTINYPAISEWYDNGPASIQPWATDPSKATYTFQVHTTVWVSEGDNLEVCGQKDFDWGRYFQETRVITASLGDFVWWDYNANGVQEDGEPGIEGVTVTLYTSTGTMVASTTTDANGHYLFEDLTPGDYYVVFSKPGGYAFVPQDQGDDAKDNDADSNGRTADVTLDPSENDMTVDAGLYKKISPILDCVTFNCDGTLTAHFGYLNPNPETVVIPVGSDNKFTPAPQDRGQPTEFLPGRTAHYPDGGFGVTWDGSGNLVWTLNGKTSTASKNSKECPCEELVPDFKADPLVGSSPLTVEFTDLSQGEICEWHWDFGDGGTSDEQNPTHVYDPPVDPKYTVTLTVVDRCGNEATEVKKNYITVYLKVTADFDAEPTVGYGPLTVHFDNKSTGTINSFMWDFGDGTSSTEHSPIHCYEEPGVYTVTLKATGPMESFTKEVKGLVEVYDETVMPGYLPMKLVEGSDVWSEKEGWENAIDQDTYWWTGTTNAGKSDVWAIFEFDDEMDHVINKFRMMTDTRVPEKQGDWVTRFKLMASTTGTAEGDFALVGEFTNTNGGWNEFIFDPVAIKYLKVMVDEPSTGWRQVGEIEAYEFLNIEEIDGSTLTATSPHYASGLDASVVTVKVVDRYGNPISGLPGSAFRIVANGCINVLGGFEETDAGTYVGSFTSIHTGDKNVVVYVYGHKVSSSSATEESPVVVTFVEPNYELAGLQFVSGTECYEGEGWENAFDGDVEGADAMVSAGPKWGDSFAIFEFADGASKTIHKYRMITNVANGWEGHWVTHYQVMVSTTGTEPDDFTLLHDCHRTTGDWEVFVLEPVDVKYIKLVLLQPAGSWKQVGEIEFFTVPTPSMSKMLAGNILSNNSNLAAPLTFALKQNYPNPFNPETVIEFHLPAISNVKLNIFNIQGQLIRSLENNIRPAGIHKVIWDSRNESGVKVGSGIYFYQIQATSESGKRFTQTNRMILLK